MEEQRARRERHEDVKEKEKHGDGRIVRFHCACLRTERFLRQLTLSSALSFPGPAVFSQTVILSFFIVYGHE